VARAGWNVVQTPVAAGLAWYIAHTLLGHHQPFFAPTAAAVSLSKNRALRTQSVLQLMGGVVLGIGVGAAVEAVTGPAAGVVGSGAGTVGAGTAGTAGAAGAGTVGAVAIAVAVAVALLLTLSVGGGFLERGVLFVNQGTTSAILMIAVAGAATATERLSDALVGGGVALAMTVVLFPAAPLPLIAEADGRVLAALRDTLARLAGPGERPGPEWALAAGQRVHARLAALDEAESTARQVVVFAPRYWPQRPRIRRACAEAAPLHLLAASVLSLAHACAAVPTGPTETTGPVEIAGSSRTAGSAGATGPAGATTPAGSTGPAGITASEPWPEPLRAAMAELSSAFAALADSDGTGSAAGSAQAVRHAGRARSLVACPDDHHGAGEGDPAHARFAAMLTAACAADMIKYAERLQDHGSFPQNAKSEPFGPQNLSRNMIVSVAFRDTPTEVSIP
jgi:uncharacterized membrane protein YgaE (UPF0421/DUF939 family)